MDNWIRLYSLEFISFWWLFIIVIIAILKRSSLQLFVQIHHNNLSATLYQDLWRLASLFILLLLAFPKSVFCELSDWFVYGIGVP